MSCNQLYNLQYFYSDFIQRLKRYINDANHKWPKEKEIRERFGELVPFYFLSSRDENIPISLSLAKILIVREPKMVLQRVSPKLKLKVYYKYNQTGYIIRSQDLNIKIFQKINDNLALVYDYLTNVSTLIKKHMDNDIEVHDLIGPLEYGQSSSVLLLDRFGLRIYTNVYTTHRVHEMKKLVSYVKLKTKTLPEFKSFIIFPYNGYTIKRAYGYFAYDKNSTFPPIEIATPKFGNYLGDPFIQEEYVVNKKTRYI